MPFEPGQSGNPGGVPKALPHVRYLARQHTEKAMQALIEALSDGEDHRTKIAAAQAILDRAWGKAPQAVAGEDGEGPAELILRWANQSKS